jgi:hypothetical protein
LSIAAFDVADEKYGVIDSRDTVNPCNGNNLNGWANHRVYMFNRALNCDFPLVNASEAGGSGSKAAA